MFTEKNMLHAVQMTGRDFLDTMDHLGPLLPQDNVILEGQPETQQWYLNTARVSCSQKFCDLASG